VVIERGRDQVGQVSVDIRHGVDQRADLRVVEVVTGGPSTRGLERIDSTDAPLVSVIFRTPAVQCGLALDVALVVSDDQASRLVSLPGGLTGCLRSVEELLCFVETSGLAVAVDDSAHRATATHAG